MFDDIITGIRYVLDFIKAREYRGPARIGEVREWKTGRWKKHGPGDWRPLGGGSAHLGQMSVRGNPAQLQHEINRVEGEEGKIVHDERKHGAEEAARRHNARMNRMINAITDPDKAERRALIFHAKGHDLLARKFMARAIELGGKTVEDESAQTSAVGVSAAALQSQLGPAAYSAPSAPSVPKAPEPSRHLGEGGTQLSQAERQAVAHAKAMGDPAALAAARKKRAERKHRLRAKKGYLKRKEAAKAVVAAKPPEPKPPGAQTLSNIQAAQLSVAERAAIAAAQGDEKQKLKAARAKRQHVHRAKKAYRKQKAAKAAVAAGGASVPVKVPPAIKPATAEPAPRGEAAGSPPPSSKDSPALSAKDTTPWVRNSTEMEKKLMQPIAAWSTTLKELKGEKVGNVNATFFNKTADGTRFVFKPHRIGMGMEYLRPGDYNLDVRETEREKCTYELDRALGFGIVPPTVVREDTIPEKYMKYLETHPIKVGFGEKVYLLADLDPPYPGHGGWKTKGSAMYIVPDSKWWSKSPEASKPMSQMPAQLQRDLVKTAIFDFITGTTDRHARNLLVDSNGHLVAIDNGLCFPWKEAPSEVHRLRSVAFDHVVNHKYGNGGKIPADVLDHLRSIRKEQIVDMMKTYGLDKEAEHCWMRLQAIVRAGKLAEELQWTWAEGGGT